MVDTPVLYITFARPEYASQSFAAIKKAKPKKLYFYSNKAREDKLDEVASNEEVRSYIRQIDWNCEVKTWFRDEYVDIYTSLWGAIDWVFANEKKAIIIEEDVVASLAFFDYVDKIIDKYENNTNIWMISGNNATPQYNPKDLSYWGTRFIHIFGWASWASRWRRLDKKMQYWPTCRNSKEYKDYWGSRLISIVQRLYYDKVFNAMEKYNPWDFIFSYNMIRNEGYCIIPKYNLVADVGVSGVHHKQKIESVYQIDKVIPDIYDIVHEPVTIRPTSYDRGHFYNYILKGLLKRKFLKLINLY